VSDELGFEEADEVGFMDGGSERGRKKFVGEDTGARCEGVGGYAFVSCNNAGRHVSTWRWVAVKGVLIIVGEA
jgi:hypothetical protein